MKTFQLYIAIPQEDKFALDFFDGDRLFRFQEFMSIDEGKEMLLFFAKVLYGTMRE
jgi:hypothetical protein